MIQVLFRPNWARYANVISFKCSGHLLEALSIGITVLAGSGISAVEEKGKVFVKRLFLVVQIVFCAHLL